MTDNGAFKISSNSIIVDKIVSTKNSGALFFHDLHQKKSTNDAVILLEFYMSKGPLTSGSSCQRILSLLMMSGLTIMLIIIFSFYFSVISAIFLVSLIFILVGIVELTIALFLSLCQNKILLQNIITYLRKSIEIKGEEVCQKIESVDVSTLEEVQDVQKDHLQLELLLNNITPLMKNKRGPLLSLSIVINLLKAKIKILSAIRISAIRIEEESNIKEVGRSVHTLFGVCLPIRGCQGEIRNLGLVSIKLLGDAIVLMRGDINKTLRHSVKVLEINMEELILEFMMEIEKNKTAETLGKVLILIESEKNKTAETLGKVLILIDQAFLLGRRMLEG